MAITTKDMVAMSRRAALALNTQTGLEMSLEMRDAVVADVQAAKHWEDLTPWVREFILNPDREELTRPTLLAPVPSSRIRTTTSTNNRYGGRCGACKRWVEANAGHLVKIDGRWVVFHKQGEHPVGGEFGLLKEEAPAVPGEELVVFIMEAERGLTPDQSSLKMTEDRRKAFEEIASDDPRPCSSPDSAGP